jgi:hypothetical protein
MKRIPYDPEKLIKEFVGTLFYDAFSVTRLYNIYDIMTSE